MKTSTRSRLWFTGVMTAALFGAMPVAWFDRARGRASPEVPECQRNPGWLAYAESHGGNVKVEINQGEYVFIYAVWLL